MFLKYQKYKIDDKSSIQLKFYKVFVLSVGTYADLFIIASLSIGKIEVSHNCKLAFSISGIFINKISVVMFGRAPLFCRECEAAIYT